MINPDHQDKCCCSHGSHCHGNETHEHGLIGNFRREIFSSLILLIAWFVIPEITDSVFIEITAYILALLPVGIPVLISALGEWKHGDFFNEFTLMLLAATGAFVIGEHPEAVAILLFYSIGEKLEDIVSGDVKSQVKNLLGSLPSEVTVISGNGQKKMKPENVMPGQIISVKPGEAVSLDGILTSEISMDFDTSAMTGESVPRSFMPGDEISAGLIPVDREASIRVSRPFADSSMNRIIKMIEDASANRSPSETILRKITRWYTPAVILCALLLMFVPWLVSISGSTAYLWQTWFRRALVFLVCSCPCALIVSVPLTYFASIGIASRKGILFKGHRQLDVMRKFRTICLDKTGTLTTGLFHVDHIHSGSSFSADEILSLAAGLDAASSHPLAAAILNEAERRESQFAEVSDIQTIPHGMRGIFNNKILLAGSETLMGAFGISIPSDLNDKGSTPVHLSLDNNYIGSILLEDTLKPEAITLTDRLHKLGVKKVGILSGDHETAVRKVTEKTGADFYKAALRPEGKTEFINTLSADGSAVAFVGDGINDGPALAAACPGIAMGREGTDIAIESADVVIATDNLDKITEGIKISERVKSVIFENVIFAFGVKIIIMALGAMGIATLWAAVFADTGVTLITILWTLYRLKIWTLKRKKLSQ